LSSEKAKVGVVARAGQGAMLRFCCLFFCPSRGSEKGGIEFAVLDFLLRKKEVAEKKAHASGC
jgi:hypothetical protein